MSSNPLLSSSHLPAFQAIQPEHAEAAIDQLLTENRADLAALLSQPQHPSWQSLLAPLEALEDRLNKAWSPVRHLNSVKNTAELREAYNACLPKLSEYASELGQNEALFQAIRTLSQSPEAVHFDYAQRKTLENALRDFRLSGVDLPEDKKQRYRDIQQELSQITSKFEENILDATNTWEKLITDETLLDGLTKNACALAKQTAAERGKEGYLFTLEAPSYLGIMTYSTQRALREEFYTAYTTRASDQGPHAKELDNSAHMEKILALRHELALLLGFTNYAELSLATKMAKTPQQVIDFLRDLAARSKPMAAQELQELRDFARTELGIEDLQTWDVAFASEKLRQQRYSISEEELRPYFPAPRVINGMFEVVQRIYGLCIQAKEGVETWHKDVTFYEITDAQGNLRGHFYLDPFARSKKRGGAWMDECRNRRHSNGGIQTPVAYLTCNFTPPVGDDPALLTHDEVQTLFHEFGHGLHHMLTQINYASVSGINGVAWDAVELPSQFMENFCWEREVLDFLSGHYQTGKSLPEELLQKMLAAKNFQSGMQMVRQLEFGLFDMRMHSEYSPEQDGRIQQILDEVRAEVAVLHPPRSNRFQHSFSHIFAGGYAAGYYSYKWAEVLSSDAYSLFEENGVLNPKTGQAFLQAILEQGGAKDAMELFVTFRGREPKIDALLRHNGIA